jgi:hypothetical protein
LTAGTGQTVQIVGPLARLTNGWFQISLMSAPGTAIEVQASSNLVNWVPLFVVTNDTGLVQVTDPTAAGLNRRFYRALLK